MPVLRRLVPTNARGLTPGNWGMYSDGTIPPPGYTGGIGASGVAVNETAALSLIDAYACIALLVDDVSQLPIRSFRRGDETRTPIDPPAVVADPDPEIEQWEWVARVVASLATSGNAYGYLYDRDRRGYPQRCTVIHPDDVAPRRNRDTGAREYAIRSAQHGHDVLPASEVLHIPWVVLPGALKGLSPIECARRGLGLSIATEEFGAKFFGEGATPSSVLESDANVDDTDAQRVTARWIASHGGRRRPAFLGGGLKWRQVSINPNESQFLETRKLNTSQVARIWRIPPYMIGDVEKSTSWGSGIEEQGIGYVVHTLGTYVARVERGLSSKKISPRDQYAKFNVAALLRGNTKDRYLAYAIGRQWGWLSVNDIRRNEDMPPLPNGEGDVYLQPLNMVDAAAALEVLLKNDAKPGGGA